MSFKRTFGQGIPEDHERVGTISHNFNTVPTRNPKIQGCLVSAIIEDPKYDDLSIDELRIQDYEVIQSGQIPEAIQDQIQKNINTTYGDCIPKLPSNFYLQGGNKKRLQNRKVMDKNISQGEDEDYISHLKQLFQNPNFSDITFVLQGQEIVAHKNIIAMRCKFFENMFTIGMTESNSTKIEINDIQFSTFKSLLEFIYCNEIKFTEELALDLLKVSDKYSFHELKDVCEKFLGDHLTLENFVLLAQAADQFEAFKLRNAIIDFVIKNRDALKNREKSTSISKELLWDIAFKLGTKPLWN